jgi:transposase
MNQPDAPQQPYSPPPLRPGKKARTARRTLDSFRLGALPILNRILQRLRLGEFLRDYLPREDKRSRVPTAAALLVLLRNLLLSREPLYGVGEWAARYAPDLLGLSADQLDGLNDDRVGRCLDRLFQSDVASLALAVATLAITEFKVELDELHNDSTTVTFHGAYPNAAEEKARHGKTTLAITWGHNKDHRPDLKQLLYILTVSGDGGVPVHFQAQSGNVTDDKTHRATWDLLCKLTGRRDFLYVADCKLATAENMAYIHQRGGRFLSVLPRTRGEDRAFREAILQKQVQWQPIHDKRNERGEVVDHYCVCESPTVSAEGYRLVWYHSTRKAELDAEARVRQVGKASAQLTELSRKLASPRSRYRQRAKVEEAVAEVVEACAVGAWITTEIQERTVETYRQKGRGRPSDATVYVRHTSSRFELTFRIDYERLNAERGCDGIFPLITNELSLSERDLLLAYKRQPWIERRFTQLKTDFEVAPVYLKDVSRIQALLCVYFFVMLIEALLERELRRAMDREETDSLPLYPESRPSRRPTARRVIDLFEDVQRHALVVGKKPPLVFTTELTGLQREVIRLLGMRTAYDR